MPPKPQHRPNFRQQSKPQPDIGTNPVQPPNRQPTAEEIRAVIEAAGGESSRVVGDFIPEAEDQSEPLSFPEEETTDLEQQELEWFRALITVGRRHKTINVMDHSVAIQTLTIADELRIGLFCLAGETPVITSEGTRPIRELSGGVHRILTSGGKWVEAPFKSFGEQALMRVVVQRNGRQREFFATPNHRWFVEKHAAPRRGMNATWKGWWKEEKMTQDLQPGVRLVSTYGRNFCKNIIPSTFGIAHGFVYGDGSLATRNRGSVVDLHEAKDLAMLKYFNNSAVSTYPLADGPTPRISGLPNHFKNRPPLTESLSYLYGWLAGYFAADGTVNKSGVYLDSARLSNIEHAQAICQLLGIHTSDIYVIKRASSTLPGGAQCNPRTMYQLRMESASLTEKFFCIPAHRDKWLLHAGRKSRESWRVISVENTDRIEEVYCAVVPTTEAFTLGGNVLTGNCKDYQGSQADYRSYQLAVVAAGVRTVDGQPLYQSLAEKPDEDAVFAEKVNKLKEYYPVVISRIYNEIVELDKEFVDLADKLGKR